MNDRRDDATPDHDVAFARLETADPARDATPDLPRLEHAVRERTSATSDSGVVDEIASRRERSTPRWLRAAAAAAAAAVVVGGGGFALGRSFDTPAQPGNTLTARGAAEPAPGDAVTAPGGTDQARAPAVSSDAALRETGFGGRIVFTSSGLSDERASAQAWALNPRKVFAKERVVELAQVFDVPGAPELRDGTWTVSAGDGRAGSVRLEPDGLATFSFYDPTRTPECAKLEGSTEPDGTDVAPPRPPECRADVVKIGKAPSKNAAVAEAKRLVRSLGLDPADFEYDAVEQQPGQTVTVVAHALVGGHRPGITWHRSGITWHFNWLGDGVQSVNGALAPVVALGSYDVVSEQEAASRLNDPRFGAAAFVGPFARDRGAGTVLDGGGSVSSRGVEPRTAPPAPEPGIRVPWPVDRVTLTKARLGLALHYQADGRQLLLPTYELSANDGRTWSVLAVAERHLDFAPAR